MYNEKHFGIFKLSGLVYAIKRLFKIKNGGIPFTLRFLWAGHPLVGTFTIQKSIEKNAIVFIDVKREEKAQLVLVALVLQQMMKKFI